jgi:hypothetical protein
VLRAKATIRSIPRSTVTDAAARGDGSAALLDGLTQIRFLAIGQADSPVTLPLLALLTFWFAVIALGLNLFAPRNATILVLDRICAVSVAGAIFIILEMEHPVRRRDPPVRHRFAPRRRRCASSARRARKRRRALS